MLTCADMGTDATQHNTSVHATCYPRISQLMIASGVISGKPIEHGPEKACTYNIKQTTKVAPSMHGQMLEKFWSLT